MTKKAVAAVCSLALLLLYFPLKSQVDTLNNNERDMTFTGTSLNPYDADSDSSGKVVWGGYVDAYYASYTDTSGLGSFQKFPTVSPRNNSFGLNIAQVSARYLSRRFRGAMTLFMGDVANSAWSPQMNMIQEANAGFRIGKRLWIDAGFFRTHLGLESIQPRENMTLSIATTTYFEPYYLSGAKLTWEAHSKWTIQASVFNGFNGFIETNRNKALGISIAYQPNKNLTLMYGNLYSEESPGNIRGNQNRLYNDFYAVYKHRRLTIGFEANYGMQKHTSIDSSNRTAQMFSCFLATKYRMTHRWASYVRAEYFNDPDEMLTGPVQNEYHQLIGLKVGGITLGAEYKPIPNSYVRIEGRWLEARKDEHIFLLNGSPSHYRYELLCGIGLWF